MASRGARHRDRRGLSARPQRRRVLRAPDAPARARSGRCPPEERKDLQATHAARYEGFSPQPEIPAMKARRLDRGSQFALIACVQAVAEAGYAHRRRPRGHRHRHGHGLGRRRRADRIPARPHPRVAGGRAARSTFPNTVANAPASQVSIELKIYGPNVTITQKDPSALNALLFSDARPLLGPRPGDARGRRGRVESLLRDGLRPRRRAARRETRLAASSRARAPSSILLEDEETRAGAAAPRPLARLAGHRARPASPSEPYRFAPDRRGDGARDARRPRRRGRAARATSTSGCPRATASGDGPRRGRGVRGRLRRAAARASSPSRTRSARWPRPAARSSSRPRRAIAGGQRRPRRALVNSFGAGGNFLAAVLESPA